MPSYVRAGIRKCARIRALSPQTDVEIALGVGLLFFLWKRHALLRIILSYGYDGFTEA